MSHRISPELQDLHAYVDNELPPHEERRVEAYLQQHPEDKQRIEDYKALKEGLKALYDPVLSEPVPTRRRAWASTNWRRLKSSSALAMARSTSPEESRQLNGICSLRF